MSSDMSAWGYVVRSVAHMKVRPMGLITTQMAGSDSVNQTRLQCAQEASTMADQNIWAP
jgi:hypothetical protein